MLLTVHLDPDVILYFFWGVSLTSIIIYLIGLGIPPQVHNPGQQHPIPMSNQTPNRQQLLPQNIQNSIASQPSNIAQALKNLDSMFLKELVGTLKVHEQEV